MSGNRRLVRATGELVQGAENACGAQFGLVSHLRTIGFRFMWFVLTTMCSLPQAHESANRSGCLFTLLQAPSACTAMPSLTLLCRGKCARSAQHAPGGQHKFCDYPCRASVHDV